MDFTGFLGFERGWRLGAWFSNRFGMVVLRVFLRFST